MQGYKLAKNVKAGMHIPGRNGSSEVVKVTLPRSQHDGVQITTRESLFRFGGGMHFSPRAKVKVLK